MASETPGTTVSLVGQGSFLTKSSLHMVGCSGKESDTFATPPDGLCPLCKAKGQSQVLKTYRLNFTQSIFLCSDPQCIYPLGHIPLDNIIANTADLKNLDSSKQKKRNISELSPPSQPNVKRSKSDLPLGQYSHTNAATSAQAESSTFLQVVPPWECDTTPSGISQCGWTVNREVPKQNVPEPSGSSICSTSVLNSKPSSPLPPPGSHYNIPGSSKLFSADQDRLYEEPLQSEDVKMIDKLYSTDADTKIPNQLSETEGLEGSEDEELRNPGPHSSPERTKSLNLLSENSITLNGSPGILESIKLSACSVAFSKHILPTPLQQNQLCAQMKDKSPQEVSTTLSSGESAVPDSGGSLREMESAQPCDFIHNTLRDLCETMESHLLQCTDQVQHNTAALVDGSCAEGNQHKDLSASGDLIEDSQSASFESTLFPVPGQGDESEHILNKTLLKPVSPHVEASFKENINDDPVGVFEPESSKAPHLIQDSCGTTSTSYSSHDIQPTCLSDNCSVDVCEQPCTIASVMKDCSIEELTAASLKVCHLSASVQLAENMEKMHIETTPSSRSVEDIQPDLALEVDSSLNLPGISCMTDAVVHYSSVSPREAPLSESHLSDQGCQHSSSETATPSALVQDILPECQSQGKPLSDMSLTPCTSQSSFTEENNPSVASAQIIIPDTPLPEQLVLVYDCQKSVCDRITSSDSVQVTRSDECSWTEVSNTVCPVSEKGNSSTEQEIPPLPNHPLLETTKWTQDSVEACEVSTSPRNNQAASTNEDNFILGVTGSSCNTTYSMDDGDHAEIPASLSESQIENSTLEPCSQAEGVVEKEAQLLHDTSAVEDIGSANQVAAPLSDSAESMRTIRKTSFENAVLPDLLLDIQPEHRTEEQLSAVPSPKCDADLMVTMSADCTHPDKLFVQDAEMNKMEITDPDISNDELQNRMNLSDTLSLEVTLNNESIDGGPIDLSVKNIEQSRSDQMLEARTYENSQRLLQWKNRKSLCWLDCILSTLVHSRTIGVCVAKNENNKESIILNLFAKYGEATALYKTILKKNKSGKPTKAEACLHEVRMHIFDKIKPLLKCDLGNYESPVFAFPLLLKLEPDFQKLFVHSFTWNFKCESCGYTYQDRSQKTMTTFTKIVQDWRPLNAAHKSPCNKCQATDQRREMHLETLQSMFMLHFVEGLPSSDLKAYAFQFGEHWYEIRTVIRYRDQHFSSWMANDDDTWLESDDLKGSFCRRHQKFRMRAEDIHIVIWERSNRKNIQEENSQLSSTVHISDIKSENQTSIPSAEIGHSDPSGESPLVAPEADVGNQAPTEYLPQVALTSKCILSDSSPEHPAQRAPVVETNLPAPLSVVPISGSVIKNISNPLAGMEGYADDDIITLTLVEIPFDSTNRAPDVKSSNPGVTQVESSPDNVLQPAPTEMQINCAKLPQNTDLRQGTNSQAESPRSDALLAPNSTIQPIPSQPCPRRKRNCNMPATSVTTSTPSSKTFHAKKSIVDNLMGTLVKDDNFFLNSTFSNANKKTTTSRPWQPATLLKESDFNGTPKKAENFDGFRAKAVNDIKISDGSSLLISKLLNNSTSFNVPKEKPATSVKSFLAPTALGQMKQGKNGISYGKMLAKDGGLSGEDKVRKLRVKLLKKLKAKKNELAMLEKVAKLQPNGSSAGGVLPGTVNRREHLRGFLQELQDHIDNTDNESIGTMSSCTSMCSSPGDAEFFAELFSPSPVDKSENDCRFLEMLADGYGISAEHSQQATGFDYPMNNTTPQSTSGADSFPNTFNQSSGEESLNLLSSSTMSMLNEDNGYLDSFVDVF